MSLEIEGLKSVLDAQPYELDDKLKLRLFRKNLLDELVHHFQNNTMYRKFCVKNNFYPQSFVGDITAIPYIPVHIFKALGHKLSSVEIGTIKSSLQSSATSGIPSTILIDKITARRQTKAMARVMQGVLGSTRRPFCVMDIDPRGQQSAILGARSAAVKGYLNFASTQRFFIAASDSQGELQFLKDSFVSYIESLDPSVPVIIFGFTFVLYHTVIAALRNEQITVKLPKGSKVIHIGGWKKLEEQKVNKNTFNNDVSSVLGVGKSNVIDIYGFTEQMGLNYPDCSAHWKHVHAYSEVYIRDEAKLTLCENGVEGLLQFVSPLQHSYPGNVVLTDDIGVINDGLCACGVAGRRFRVLGRAKKAEVRGCGDIMADKVYQAKSSLKDQELSQNLEIYHSPIIVDDKESPLETLKAILSALEKRQQWLSEQPVEAILGLINEARKTWSSNVQLAPFQDQGLGFLAEWCDPTRLRKLLDAALHGQRGCLDQFVPRKDIASSSIKAVPRGTVAHWLSGNVPLLGMFALVQSMLSKNVNILKVSAGESQALPALLNSFKGLTYKTPGGYLIKGDDLLGTIAVVYFDRSQGKIAECFSASADVRVAWGGREAVESVAALPKKYTCQDILFGPKLSMMVIDRYALDSPKNIRKLIRRAATDASVFDQFACASPHTIFIEKGGSISPKEFAEELCSGMDKALTRLPTAIPDVGQANKIRSKIAEFSFIGESWHDESLRWTVLFSEDAKLVDPTYQRVITVKAVDDIFDVLEGVHEDIQTVGLAMQGDRRLQFANQIINKGAMRCPDIGFMTHFDSPWDGLFVLDRFVRWTTLGGPV
jgi:hypothetical protein